MLTYGSVCSGIEAATVAMKPHGWKAAWFAEIEPFPSAVLAHHYPETPNLGDMTKIAAQVRAGGVAAPDVLVGGTPCQAFSIAGLRAGLDDARGQLTLSFVDLADAIDSARHVLGQPESIVWWENVPGVLSSADNAFGCFLAALAGEVRELQPPGGAWKNAGCVFGPFRTVAWRVLDAQYFGVAQRRRRVFVVASARRGFDPVAVLFESDSVRRDSAPRREAGKGTAGTLASRTNGGGFPGTDEACLGYVQPVACYGGGRIGGPIDIAACLTAKGQRIDFEVETFAVQAPIAFDCKASGQSGFGVGEIAGTMRSMNSAKSHANGGRHLAVCVTGDVTHTLKADGFDASEDGTGRGQPIIAFQTRGSNLHIGEISGTLGTNAGDASGGAPMVQQLMAVRRLTPRECERLQAFPDEYTMVPVRGKPAADGPRYKALGNSMCVRNMRWIGLRIAAQIRASLSLERAA